MNIPEGVLYDKKPYVLQGKKILILADLHIPYHCKKSIDKALALGKKEKINTILINGDLTDFFAISRFNKAPNNPNLQYEINATNQILIHIRKLFPKATIYWKLGNHEVRLEKYLNDHPELFSLDCLKFENLFKVKELKIRLIDETNVMQVGNIFIAHGHEIAAGGITPAKNLLNKWHCNLIFSHLHRPDEYHFRQFDGTYLKTYSTGCLCHLQPKYWTNNNWANGICLIKRISKTKTEVNNVRL